MLSPRSSLFLLNRGLRKATGKALSQRLGVLKIWQAGTWVFLISIFQWHGCNQSLRLFLSEQDHSLLLPWWVEGRTLGKCHSTSYTLVFQLRWIFSCAARAWSNSWQGCRELAAALGGRNFKTNPDLVVTIWHQQVGTCLNRSGGWDLIQMRQIPSAEIIFVRFPQLCWKFSLTGRQVEAWEMLLWCCCAIVVSQYDVTFMAFWRMRTG